MGKMFNPKIITIDPAPTQGSSNAVSSGGMYDEMEKVSDVSIAQLISLFGSYQYANQRPLLRTVTLAASGWSNGSQTVTVTGVLADESAQRITPIPALSSQTAYIDAGIRVTAQSANALTFSADTAPTVDLTVYVTIEGVRTA